MPPCSRFIPVSFSPHSRPLVFPTCPLPFRPPCRLWLSVCPSAFFSLVSVSSPHPTGLAAEEGSLAGLATSCHLSLRTQTWEGGTGAAPGPWACWLGCGRRGHGKGGSPLSAPPAPLFPQPQRSFLPFFRLLLPLLFILPKYAQAVIMGPESSHTQPAPASLPPSWPHGPPHRAPCRPRLMGARWPPSDSATGLWEPRRPAFPCPHTRLLLP